MVGGGTGGHLTPGMAVAEQLLRSGACRRVVFAGTDRPVERPLLEQSGFEHRALPLPSMRPSPWRPVRWVLENINAVRAPRALLAELAPQVVIGLGGAASVLPALAALRAGIPLVLLEQNVVPGRATRLLARWAAAICVAFEETRPMLRTSAPVHATGNPVRAAIAELASLPDPVAHGCGSRFELLILGGSQGSNAVNEAVMTMIARDPAAWRGCRFEHQAGSLQHEEVRAAYARLGLEARVRPFINDIEKCYRLAHLAIARAGATTLAELACAKLPALLIPYPMATDNHQARNAEHFARAGAARVVPQHRDGQATAAALEQALVALRQDPDCLRQMRGAMARLAQPRAALAVLEVLKSFAGQSTC